MQANEAMEVTTAEVEDLQRHEEQSAEVVEGPTGNRLDLGLQDGSPRAGLVSVDDEVAAEVASIIVAVLPNDPAYDHLRAVLVERIAEGLKARPNEFGRLAQACHAAIGPFRSSSHASSKRKLSEDEAGKLSTKKARHEVSTQELLRKLFTSISIEWGPESAEAERLLNLSTLPPFPGDEEAMKKVLLDDSKVSKRSRLRHLQSFQQGRNLDHISNGIDNAYPTLKPREKQAYLTRFIATSGLTTLMPTLRSKQTLWRNLGAYPMFRFVRSDLKEMEKKSAVIKSYLESNPDEAKFWAMELQEYKAWLASATGYPPSKNVTGSGADLQHQTQNLEEARREAEEAEQPTPNPQPDISPSSDEIASQTSERVRVINNILGMPICATPPYFLCPITNEVMTDPVYAEDGFTYERAALEEWIRTRADDHGTVIGPNGELISMRFVANVAMRKHIEAWRRKRNALVKYRNTGRSEEILARQLHHCYEDIQQLEKKNVRNATEHDRVNRQMIWRTHRHKELKLQLSLLEQEMQNLEHARSTQLHEAEEIKAKIVLNMQKILQCKMKIHNLQSMDTDLIDALQDLGDLTTNLRETWEREMKQNNALRQVNILMEAKVAQEILDNARTLSSSNPTRFDMLAHARALGSIEATYMVAQSLAMSGKDVEAFKAYLDLAEHHEHADSMNELSACYRQGRGEKADYWLMRAQATQRPNATPAEDPLFDPKCNSS